MNDTDNLNSDVSSAQGKIVKTRPSTVALSLAACAALILAGCSRPYLRPEVQPKGAIFPGIEDGFTTNNTSQEVDVFVMHGMCTHDRGWADESFTQFTLSLGMTSSGNTSQQPLPHGAELYKQTVEGGGHHARLAALIWSPITAPAKNQLCYDVTKPTKSCPQDPPLSHQRRATLNAGLKNQLLNDCLSDVIIYSGKLGQQIRDATKDALLTQLSSQQKSASAFAPGEVARAPVRPLFLVTDSLGSKILLDSIQELQNEGQGEFVKETLARMVALYLRANQIPLLGLTNVDPRPAKAFDALEAPLKSAIPNNLNLRADVEALPVVAFTDPNDLLSYAFAGGQYAPQKLRFTDVLVSNAPTLISFVERPDHAHTTYKSNPCVVTAIVKGSSGLDQGCSR